MSLQQYKFERYQRKAHQIKKQLKSYDELAILNACTSYIYEPAKEEIEHAQRQPWVILLVLKWSFLGRSKIIYKKEFLDDKKFYDVINGTYKLASLTKMPDAYSHYSLFLREALINSLSWTMPSL